MYTGADLIITGEGKLDKQTCMGKTPCGVLQAGMRQGIPVIVMGGSVEEVEALNKSGFLAVLPLLPYPVSLSRRWIRISLAGILGVPWNNNCV